MQFDSIAESSYMKYFQAALDNHLSKTLKKIFSLHFLLYICVFFPDKNP